VRYWSLILLMSAATCPAASVPTKHEGGAQWETEGKSLFMATEFKRATRVFEKALADQPNSAAAHYWLGRSYAHWAEMSGPLSAPKNARKARLNLEQAVKLEPQNHQYVRELFDFYVDSPEWFSGGLERATELLERISPEESTAESRLKQLADSRKDHSGVEWWMRWAVLRTSGTVGSLVPQP
jgi:tetratricopeptide (TPR) repeat protein